MDLGRNRVEEGKELLKRIVSMLMAMLRKLGETLLAILVRGRGARARAMTKRRRRPFRFSVFGGWGLANRPPSTEYREPSTECGTMEAVGCFLSRTPALECQVER